MGGRPGENESSENIYSRVGVMVQRGAGAQIELLAAPFSPATFDSALMCTAGESTRADRDAFGPVGKEPQTTEAPRGTLPEGTDLTEVYGCTADELQAFFARPENKL